MRRVEGDFIVVTDDDVLPDRDWLVERQRIADTYTNYAVFGGVIVPQFEAPPPPWLKPAWKAMLYAATDPQRRSHGPRGYLRPQCRVESLGHRRRRTFR